MLSLTAISGGLKGHASLLMTQRSLLTLEITKNLNNLGLRAIASLFHKMFRGPLTKCRHHTSFIPLILPVPSIDLLGPKGLARKNNGERLREPLYT